MIVLAGIDEAGLGPTIGPLATACAALSVPDGWTPESLWERLSTAVASRFGRRDPRPAIGDSKEVYRGGGMAALELAVGVFSRLGSRRPAPDLSVAEDADGGGPHPCYTLGLDPCPLLCDEGAVEEAARRVGECLAENGVRAERLEARTLPEPALNGRYARGLNKNQALLAETGWHLTRLSARFPANRVLAVVDKQGGRNDYLPFLIDLFPGTWMETLALGPALSAYRLRRPGGDMEIRFLPKADRLSFPTALASLAAKYVRERAMRELNDWFGRRIPGLRPTAGYPEDAKRWLGEVRSAGGSDLGLELVIRRK